MSRPRAGWPAPSPPPSQGLSLPAWLWASPSFSPCRQAISALPWHSPVSQGLGSSPGGCLRASPSSHSIMSPPHHAEVRIRNPISQMRPLRIRGSYASHTLGSLRALRRVSTYHLFTIQSQQNVSPQVLCPKAQPE